ncbi:hypothetical protein CDO52_17195 [Nocardiopsis gilva YIM 90087]|uniref:Uncharacterized protein n=1 Tax=Nocardiopsis gilva YIM 90087 TaxID=1235441 RepID=A0A223S855_9ACTN|nr:hypothetical protein [Nocardiopsis gilva]ASU84301.1 hypothetical protein CDO52_17195 [Nocardiopsis gilva YIM 90087]
MTDQQPRRADDATGTAPDQPPITGMPRWVKVFGILAIAVLVTIAIVHLAGGGMGNHGHGAGDAASSGAVAEQQQSAQRS